MNSPYLLYLAAQSIQTDRQQESELARLQRLLGEAKRKERFLRRAYVGLFEMLKRRPTQSGIENYKGSFQS